MACRLIFVYLFSLVRFNALELVRFSFCFTCSFCFKKTKTVPDLATTLRLAKPKLQGQVIPKHETESCPPSTHTQVTPQKSQVSNISRGRNDILHQPNRQKCLRTIKRPQNQVQKHTHTHTHLFNSKLQAAHSDRNKVVNSAKKCVDWILVATE